MQAWPMRPLLEDDDGNRITDAATWQLRAASIRDTILSTLGAVPPTQRFGGCSPGEPMPDGDVVRTPLRITVDEGDVMPAWLIEPVKEPETRRVALALHQTTKHGKAEVAGLAGAPPLAYGLELAKRGWTVLAPDQLAVESRYAHGLRAYDTARFYERFPQWSAVGKMITDARIAVDALMHLPQTADLPVYAIGHSLGGQTAALVAAFDSRIAGAVSNCGVFPFATCANRASWFREEWYIYLKDAALKQSVLEGPQPLWDWHELCALIAPRPLMLLASPADPLADDQAGFTMMHWELFELYDMLGAAERFSAVTHGEGHAFTAAQRAYAYGWLEQQAASDSASDGETHNAE